MQKIPAFGRAFDSLKQQLAQTHDIPLQRILRVQIAGLLTRQGRMDEARQMIAQLRAENVGYEPRLSAWIMFTEGLVKHFESLDVLGARDWFRRAYAVAVATGDGELRAISAAWMADSDFRLGNVESAAGHLEKAFGWSSEANHEALGRSCLVLADLLSWAGLHNDARNWYRSARGHAVALGDIGMQSVVLFNSVSFRVSALVLRGCQGSIDKEAAVTLGREITSVSNLDMGLGITTLGSMIPALRAELDTLVGNWQSAIDGFDSFMDDVSRDGQDRLAAKFLAHRAMCLAKSSRRSEAELDIERTLVSIDQCPDLDDLAVVYSRLASTHATLGNVAESESFGVLAHRSFEAFAESQKSLGEVANRVMLVGARHTL